MNESKKRYDRKWKVTRILLSDYLVLKSMSVQAGISMAEALHKLITNQVKQKLSTILDTQVSIPVFQVVSQPVLAINGHKPGILIIKPKGGVITNGR